MSPSLVHQHHEQALEANCQIDLQSVMSYHLYGSDVALKNFAMYFLLQSREELEYADKVMKVQN